MHGQWISHAIEAIMTVSSLDLELLLPLAVAWAEEQAAVIAQIGYPLDQELAALATGVGVTAPGRIRIPAHSTWPQRNSNPACSP